MHLRHAIRTAGRGGGSGRALAIVVARNLLYACVFNSRRWAIDGAVAAEAIELIGKLSIFRVEIDGIPRTPHLLHQLEVGVARQQGVRIRVKVLLVLVILLTRISTITSISTVTSIFTINDTSTFYSLMVFIIVIVLEIFTPY